MTSGRQRRDEINARRTLKRGHAVALAERERAKERARFLRGKVVVNPSLLRPDNSYGTPDFVQRGYYVDRAFRCKDCGASEIWTDTQQKWWYEVAHGGVWTVAVRCRNCRRRERDRKSAARRIESEGRERKAARESRE